MLCAAVLIATAAGHPVAATQTTDRPPAETVARAVQQHYDGVHDFSADFTHVYEGGALRRKTTERGVVLVKKPGRMRWTYKSPEEKLFVSDGHKIYFYVPADKQVTVSSMPSDDKASTPILFLSGKGNLTSDFSVSYADSDMPDTVALKLIPKAKTPDYDTLILIVDRRALTLRMLIAHDAQSGTSTFTFSNLKENVGLSDSQFTFAIPRGADVITQS
jgi:outer membrane lipoprotein carrier protein